MAAPRPCRLARGDTAMDDRCGTPGGSARVLAVSGDGSAMYSISELATAKQHNVDFDLAADNGELHLVIEAKSMPVEGNAEAGRLRQARNAARFSKTPAELRRGAPMLGAHNDELLR